LAEIGLEMFVMTLDLTLAQLPISDRPALASDLPDEAARLERNALGNGQRPLCFGTEDPPMPALSALLGMGFNKGSRNNLE